MDAIEVRLAGRTHVQQHEGVVAFDARRDDPTARWEAGHCRILG
jgi:hypothetical protein